MSTFTKGRILLEPEYQQWRKCHNCNGDQVEKMDMLNKKYVDSILSEQSNREQNIEAAVDSGAVDGEVENKGIETPDETMPLVNDSPTVSNVAEGSNSNLTNELTTDPKASDNYNDTTSKQGNISNSPVAPPSTTPITQAPVSKVYNCIPNVDTSSKSVIAGEEIPKIRPYKCTIPKCEKRYATRWSLKRHIIKHHGLVEKNPKSKVIRTKGKYRRVIKSTTPYRGKNPKLIEINGTPLDDGDVSMNNDEEDEEVPLPESDGDDFSLPPPPPLPTSRWSTKSKSKKRKPQTRFNQQTLNSRIFRKRRNINNDDDDEDDLETAEKYSRGSGTNFYYSWD